MTAADRRAREDDEQAAWVEVWVAAHPPRSVANVRAASVVAKWVAVILGTALALLMFVLAAYTLVGATSWID